MVIFLQIREGQTCFIFNRGRVISFLGKEKILGFHMTSRPPCWCPKQRKGGHVGAPTKSSGNLTLLLCKRFLLFSLKNMAVDHVSENQQLLHVASISYIQAKLPVKINLNYLQVSKNLFIKKLSFPN